MVETINVNEMRCTAGREELKQDVNSDTVEILVKNKQAISALIAWSNQTSQSKFNLYVQLQSLPMPNFRQLMNFLSRIHRRKEVQVIWYYNPKEFDIWDKGRLMDELCPHVSFTFKRFEA